MEEWKEEMAGLAYFLFSSFSVALILLQGRRKKKKKKSFLGLVLGRERCLNIKFKRAV